MLIKVKGLVLRSEDRGERDRLFTILTGNEGKIYVMAKGAVAVDGKPKICLMPMLYAELVLYQKNGMHWLRESDVIEDFRKLYRDLDRLALGQYLTSLAESVAVTGQDRNGLLSLILNSLHLLSETDRSCTVIKAVVELRIALEEGYEPELDCCTRCGCVPERDSATLDVMSGSIVCRDCLAGGKKQLVPPGADEIREATVLLPLSDTVLSALRYVFSAPPKKIFSFELPEIDSVELSKVSESYLLNHIGENFPALEIYKDTIINK